MQEGYRRYGSLLPAGGIAAAPASSTTVEPLKLEVKSIVMQPPQLVATPNHYEPAELVHVGLELAIEAAGRRPGFTRAVRHTLLLLLLSPALLAGEDEKPAPKGPALMQRDTDGDGRLSPAEFGPDREIFDLLDRDGDGFLAAGELPKPRKAKGEPGAEPGAKAERGERAAKQAEKFLARTTRTATGRSG